MTTTLQEGAELQRLANEVATSMDATADAIVATVYSAYKAWCRARRLHFPAAKRLELLREILRYCVDQGHVIEAYPRMPERCFEIASMLDARYPRYARHLARTSA